MSQQQFEQFQSMVGTLSPAQLQQIQKVIDGKLAVDKTELIDDDEIEFIRSLFN